MKAAIDMQQRLAVFSRIVAAGAGGYVLTSIANLAWTLLLPVERYKALLFSMQTGFVTWTLVILWAFAARSATRAWAGLLLIGVPLGLFDVWHYFHGGVA